MRISLQPHPYAPPPPHAYPPPHPPPKNTPTPHPPLLTRGLCSTWQHRHSRARHHRSCQGGRHHGLLGGGPNRTNRTNHRRHHRLNDRSAGDPPWCCCSSTPSRLCGAADLEGQGVAAALPRACCDRQPGGIWPRWELERGGGTLSDASAVTWPVDPPLILCNFAPGLCCRLAAVKHDRYAFTARGEHHVPGQGGGDGGRGAHEPGNPVRA